MLPVRPEMLVLPFYTGPGSILSSRWPKGVIFLPWTSFLCMLVTLYSPPESPGLVPVTV